MSTILLSLCIPTNGILEWVRPVIESIYSDKNACREQFEVVVTDNGDNTEFENYMAKISKKYSNLRYAKTNAEGFLNQIVCFQMAKGEFIKFVNHRMKFIDGGLSYLLNFVNNNKDKEPVTYFLNQSLNLPDKTYCRTFDEFMKNLSYYSSWSGGIGIWRDDLNKISSYDGASNLFPHFIFLTAATNKKLYIIDNHKLFESVDDDSSKKGKYNLFYAFAVEYPFQLLILVANRKVTLETFLHIKNDLIDFLADLYLDFVLRKKKCSYDLSNRDQSLNVFYSRFELLRHVFLVGMHKGLHKILKGL